MIERIPDSFDGERVDRVVATLTGMTRSAVAVAVKAGEISVDGKAVKTRSQAVEAGQMLAFEGSTESEVRPEAQAGVDFTVVYEDEHIAVVDKPEGLVVHPGAGHPDGTLVNGLLHRYPDLDAARPGEPKRPGIVHRLDAGTTGLLVIARTAEAHVALVDALKERTIERRYLALVWGALEPETGVVDAPIGRSERHRTRMTVARSGKEARTSYRVLQRHEEPAMSLVGAKLETGRTHQIRVHFSALGHPLVGDRRYNGVRDSVALTRPFLHAWSLRFAHPITGEELLLTSPLPADLAKVLQGLDIPVPALSL